MSRSTLSPGPLIGRAKELERLDAAFEAAHGGRGHTVLLAGEAGMGKTRLVSELAERARLRDAVILIGRCIDLVGPGLPYLAFVEAFPAGGLPLPGGDPAPDDPADADARLRLFEGARAALDRLSSRAPTLLVLEDLHWADASTLDLLAVLAHAIGERRILIAATYRDDEIRMDDPMHRLVSGLLRARAATAVPIGPLDSGAIRALLREAAGRPLPTDVVETISVRSGGNRFFAEELLAVAMRGEQALPGVLRDVLLQRVSGLDATSRQVLRVAAAAGHDVSYRLLAAVLPLSDPQLQQALRAAVEHNVVTAGHAAGTFRFRHALLAEAVYATLIPGERDEAHRRLARTLADNPDLWPAGGVAGELAAHWAAAGQPVEAVVASVAAAGEAERASGLAEALRHLDRVLALWDQVPDPERLCGTDLAGSWVTRPNWPT